MKWRVDEERCLLSKKRWILHQRFVGDETPDMECPVCGYIMRWGTRVVCPNCLSHVVLRLEDK